MKNRIRSLTPRQKLDLLAFRQRWLEVGTSTAPADRPRAEKSITAMYARIGKTAPKFLWCDSPAIAALALHAIKSKGEIPASLWASLRASLWASLWDSLWASLWASLRDSLWDSLGASLGASFYGQHESYWVAFYIFCRQIGVNYKCESDSDLQLWSEVCESCGWFSVWDGLVIACERPCDQKLSVGGVGHCDDGPAIAFRDGWKVWMIDGIRLDEQIVMQPETQTIKQIDGEQNQDIRSIRIQRFGWPRYIRESGATCRDERANEIEGTLEALYRTKSGEQRLIVTCPTGRVFALGVTSDVSDCESAQSWLAGGERLNIIAAT
ncbi:MAG: DUF6745 domain-containing protein [Pyrinomonadaceae bacterium]